jgi:hypothetical protein
LDAVPAVAPEAGFPVSIAVEAYVTIATPADIDTETVEPAVTAISPNAHPPPPPATETPLAPAPKAYARIDVTPVGTT